MYMIIVLAIDLIIHEGKIGEIYNIGGNNEKSNIDVVKIILKELGKSEKLIKYVNDRPGHDLRYAIDSTKIKTTLNWKPVYSFEKGILDTIKCILKCYKLKYILRNVVMTNIF